jgi:hypothetical protein
VARVAYNEIPELFPTTGDQQELAFVLVAAVIVHATSGNGWRMILMSFEARVGQIASCFSEIRQVNWLIM